MFTGHWTIFCSNGIHSLSSPQVSFKILSHIILSYRHLSSGGSSNVQEITVILSLCFVTLHAMKAHGGVDGRTALLFLNFDSRWGGKKKFSFTPRPLYSRGKSSGIHSIESLGGPQSRSGCFIGKTRQAMDVQNKIYARSCNHCCSEK